MFWEFINFSSDVEQRSKNLNKTSWFTLCPLQYEYNHLISVNVVVFKFGILNHLPLAVNVWIIWVDSLNRKATLSWCSRWCYANSEVDQSNHPKLLNTSPKFQWFPTKLSNFDGFFEGFAGLQGSKGWKHRVCQWGGHYIDHQPEQ